MSSARRNIEVLRKIEFLEEFPQLASLLEGMAQDQEEQKTANIAQNAGLIGYELRRDPGQAETEIKALHYLAQVDKNTAALAKNLRPELSPLIEAYMDLWGTVKTAEGSVDAAQVSQLGSALGKAMDRLSEYDDGVDTAVSSLPGGVYTKLQAAFNSNTVQTRGRREFLSDTEDDMAIAMNEILTGLPSEQAKGAVIAWVSSRMGKSPGGLMQELRSANGVSSNVKQSLRTQEQELARHRRNAYTERDVLEAEKQSALQLMQRESVGMPGEMRAMFEALIKAGNESPEAMAQILGMSGPGVPETEASKKMQDLVDSILEEDGDAGYWLSDAEWRDRIISSPEWDEAVQAYGYSGDRNEIYDRLIDQWEDAAGNARDESWAEDAFRIRHGLASRPSAGDKVRAWLTAVTPGRAGKAYRNFRDQQYEEVGVPKNEDGEGWKLGGRAAYQELRENRDPIEQEIDDFTFGEIDPEEIEEGVEEAEVAEDSEAATVAEITGLPGNTMGEHLTDQTKGTAFRLWFLNTHPEKAEEIDLDAVGSHTNSYIRKAWEYAGKDFLDWKTETDRVESETAPESPPAEEAVEGEPPIRPTLPGEGTGTVEEVEEETGDVEPAPDEEDTSEEAPEEAPEEEESLTREEVEELLKKQAAAAARGQAARAESQSGQTGFDEPSQKEKNMFRDVPLTGHTEDPEFAPYPQGGWDTEAPRGPGQGATSFETTKGTGFSNVSAKAASNPNLGQAGGMQTPDRSAMAASTERIQKVMQSAQERMQKKKLEDAQRAQGGAPPPGVA